jgi:hypothetical protein
MYLQTAEQVGQSLGLGTTADADQNNAQTQPRLCTLRTPRSILIWRFVSHFRVAHSTGMTLAHSVTLEKETIDLHDCEVVYAFWTRLVYMMTCWDAPDVLLATKLLAGSSCLTGQWSLNQILSSSLPL